MKAAQISTLINEIYDGVERSKVGNIVEEVPISGQYPDGKKINPVAFNTYLGILNSLTPKNIHGDMKVAE